MIEVTDEMIEIIFELGDMGSRADMRAALIAALAIARVRIPDGWQIVPKEITLEMLRAGSGQRERGIDAIFRAMLEAAPSPPELGHAVPAVVSVGVHG